MNSQHNESQLLSLKTKNKNKTNKQTKRLGAVTTASLLTGPSHWAPSSSPYLCNTWQGNHELHNRQICVCCVLIWQLDVLFGFGGREGWVVQKWKTWPKVIWSLDSALVRYKSYFWTSSNCMRGEASQTNKTKNNDKKLIQPCWRLKMDLSWKVNPETVAQGTIQSKMSSILVYFKKQNNYKIFFLFIYLMNDIYPVYRDVSRIF